MRLLWVAFLFAAAMPASAAAPENIDIISGAIEGYIRPAFHTFHNMTDAQSQAVTALCATPDAKSLKIAQEKFRAVVLAFARIEFVHIGPLGEGDRLERLLFWPDKKGLALKQVQAALVEKDAGAANAGTLKDKSVAMQGLGALEYLLFGTGSDGLAQGDDYRCSYATAIATTINDLAVKMDAEWSDPDGVTEAIEHPKSDASDYRTETEVLEKLAATLVHGVEALRDQRLTPVLGAKGSAPKPKSALFWRSGMSVPSIAANFAGLSEFFVAARFPEAMGANNSWIATGTAFEFANAARAAGLITSPIEGAVADEKQRQALDYLVIITNSLQVLVGENLAAALNLSVGFSALDGD